MSILKESLNKPGQTDKIQDANNTNPNKFSLKPSPKGEGQDEGIHITTYWDWYNTLDSKP